MTLRIDPAAIEETREAAAWYEQQRIGLGLEFLAAVDAVIQQVAGSPQRFARLETLPEEEFVRRALVDRFPYAVIFEEHVNDTRILAVAHTHRRPNYWRQRREPDRR